METNIKIDIYKMVVITAPFASSGRNLGNKLFTYAVSKIVADTNNYALSVPPNSHIQQNGIVSDFPYNSNVGIIIDNPEYYVSDHSMLELGFDKIIEESQGKKIFMYGYFIKYEYVKNYKNNILQLYSNLFGNFDGKNDVILLLRDSNCDSTLKLPDEYYIDLINQLTFDCLYVSLDHIHKHQSLLKKIENYPITFDMEAFEIGVSAHLSGINMGEMGWRNQTEIFKVGFNANNWEKIKI